MTDPVRHLLLVLGDQLDADSTLLQQADSQQDRVWMAEVAQEATHVWSHKARITLFLAAMRHFREAIAAQGFAATYHTLESHRKTRLGELLDQDLKQLRPAAVHLVLPGDYRVYQEIREVCEAAGVPLELLTDAHFIDSPEGFADWARGRKQLRLEYYYRVLRRRTGLLMEQDQPAGDKWNFDGDNRKTFGREGPGMLPAPLAFSPDRSTSEVMALVEQRFADHPGDLASFDWAVTREQALEALDDFIRHRLPAFGPYQDALWQDEPWLYHSRLSAALNLKLLSPMEVCRAAEAAWREGQAPLQSVEGFIRQILGWREYVRGLYWYRMPDYLDGNALAAPHDLPAFYWTGETDMQCLAQAIGQTLEYGYAHHIQRLMVTGLYALLFGVRPRAVHEWYLAVYVDAVEWVEAPNTIGMSQFGDGGLMASKPYCATGKYIQRMSNYCGDCRYSPQQRVGDEACPFTTLYWDFLHRNRERLERIPRMNMQLRNLQRIDEAEMRSITATAREHRKRVG